MRKTIRFMVECDIAAVPHTPHSLYFYCAVSMKSLG